MLFGSASLAAVLNSSGLFPSTSPADSTTQIMGSMMGAFSEGMALAEKSSLKQEDLLEVLSLGAMNNPLFAMKGPGCIAHNYPPAFPLKHQQKDMRLAVALGVLPSSPRDLVILSL